MTDCSLRSRHARQVGMARHLSRIVPTRDFSFKNKHAADALAARNSSERASLVALGETRSHV